MKAVLATLSVAALATALPQSVSQCNTGTTSCCNSLTSSSNEIVTELAGLLGIALPSLGAQVGLNCDPITLLGLGGGASCNAQPVCCTGDSFSGLINLGCTALSL